MKNKITLIPLITLCALSLTACSYAFPFIGGGASNEYSYRPIDSNSSFGGGGDIPVGDIMAKKASYNYSDLASNSVYPISCTPSIGKAKLLVIPVWFSDSSSFITLNYKDKVREDIEKAYFGTTLETGWNSVKTFYETESYGALKLSGTVSDWYEVSTSYVTYAKGSDVISKTTQLVKNATAWYFNNSGESKTQYDCDHDGYLDGVMLIYAAPDYKSLNRDDYDNLWAYCFWAQEPSVKNIVNPGLNAFFWASYTYMYGPNVASVRTGKSIYCAGDTTYCHIDCHTYIHEMGHMFGLADYYDYSTNAYVPAGGFSMQDRNIGGHDPFSVYALGWAKAYIPTATATINLKPFTVSGEIIILSPSFNTINSPFDEYLLLEYYTPDGLNEFDSTYRYLGSVSSTFTTGSRDAGIRLWHVDARLLYLNGPTPNPSNITVNPRTSSGKVAMMMSNTYYDGTPGVSEYMSILGKNYADYNLLQLIRKDVNATYKPKDNLTSGSLFKVGSFFSMSTFSKQFVKTGRLNSDDYLGFTFTVNSFTSTHASITVTKQ
ncbi:MAG TPA: hypothetical protein GX010_02100 [Erysipelotrichaceae bacterium]|nr:hypothetical protein [Erysipelotrichaceae bacterium]